MSQLRDPRAVTRKHSPGTSESTTTRRPCVGRLSDLRRSSVSFCTMHSSTWALTGHSKQTGFKRPSTNDREGQNATYTGIFKEFSRSSEGWRTVVEGGNHD